MLLRKGILLAADALSVLRRFDWRLAIAAVAGFVGCVFAALGFIPALFGYAGLFKWGVTMFVLSLIGAGLLRLKGARIRPSVAAEQVDARHEQAARNIIKTWPQVSAACGLGRRVAVAQREWVPDRGGVSDIIATGGRWVNRGTKSELQSLRLVRVRSCGRGLVLDIATPAGISPANVEQAAPGIAHHYGATGWELGPCSEGVALLLLDGSDALAHLPVLTEPLAWSGDWDALPYGVTREGSVATLKLRDLSGCVVGGLPGAGKTSGLTTLLSALVASDACQFAIFDGKGGADWSWLAPRAALFNNDDEDRARVAEQLEDLVAFMRDRIRTMQARRGGSSIWTTGGPTPDMPLVVVVVDECQSYLDATMIPKGDKAGAELRQRAEAAIATLVRKGRSAGVWCIPATQKPTSDSLPTTIGSNAGAAIAFRVKTPEVEKAVLGSAGGVADPKATDLPAAPGYAVVGGEDGTRQVVRFAHLPEDVAAAHASRFAHLRVVLAGSPLTEAEA